MCRWLTGMESQDGSVYFQDLKPADLTFLDLYIFHNLTLCTFFTIACSGPDTSQKLPLLNEYKFWFYNNVCFLISEAPHKQIRLVHELILQSRICAKSLTDCKHLLQSVLVERQPMNVPKKLVRNPQRFKLIKNLITRTSLLHLSAPQSYLLPSFCWIKAIRPHSNRILAHLNYFGLRPKAYLLSILTHFSSVT